MEKDLNRGDGDDVFRGGFKTAVGAATVPNVNAYQDGAVVVSKNTIDQISPSGPAMTFRYSDGSPPPPPVDAGTKGKLGFASAHDPTAAAYAPNAGFAHNPAGGAVTVTRTGTGLYTVTFAGLGRNGAAGGHAQVTAVGPGGGTAKVVNWMSVGPDVVVNVRCAAAGGAPADALFNVLVVAP